MLEEMGDKVGHPFSNCEPDPKIYNSDTFEFMDVDIISELFENKAYVFIQEVPVPLGQSNSTRYYEGIDLTTFDENDVFVMTPDQVMNMTSKYGRSEICFVWMDANKLIRQNRHRTEKRSYVFKEREAYEQPFIGDFTKHLYNFDKAHILYFDNEVPARVAAILHTLIIHPELMDLYTNAFN